MDLERIERALRDGPADEPRYESGAFGRQRRPGWVMFVGAMAGALVVGLVIGLGLDVLRQPAGIGGPDVDLDALNESLSGGWTSDAFTRDDFVSYLTAAGHQSSDISVFLTHDPIVGTVRWGLDIDGSERLVVYRTLDDGGTEVLANGPYELLPDGRLRWTESGCSVVAEVTVDGAELSFGNLEVENCDADERIALSTFFGLASPYQLSSPH